MNFNDPFGRVARRDERDYQSLRTALKNEGVNSLRMVEAVSERARKRALGTVVAILVIMLAILTFFPEYGVLAIAIGVLILFWVAKVIISGRRHMKRYVKEELTDQAQR